MKKLCYVTTLLVGIVASAQQKLDTTKVEKLAVVELSSTKFKLKLENSGKFITKITTKQLQNSTGKSVATVLNEVAGIEINGTNSAIGQNLNYYIRGGRNQQVLIMIDGVAVNNPSSIANDFDFRLLPINDIESIEIIKGAASAVYGSGAATAVINITLKKPSQKFKGHFQTSVSTNQTQRDKHYRFTNFNQTVSISQKLNKLDYFVAFNNLSSSGMSAASDENSTIKFKDDPFLRIDVLSKLGIQLTKKIHLGTFLKYDKFKTNFDNGSFFDGNNKALSEQIRIGINGRYNYKNGNFIFNSGYGNIKNNNVETSFPNKKNGESLFIDAYNRLKINKNLHFLLGLNVVNESMETYTLPFGGANLVKKISNNNAKFTLVDPYTNLVLISNFGLNVNIGARLNIHSAYNSHFVYTINPSFNFNLGNINLKLISSASTAYITPSLFQLFSPNYGNKDIKPEEDLTFEGGFKASVHKLVFNAVYFYRKQSNFIDFELLNPTTYSYGYKNTVDEFIARGLETTINYKISKNISFASNYTYTKVDKSKNLRIPMNKVNGFINFKLSKKLNFHIDYSYTSSRTDNLFDMITFTSSQVSLKAYQLLNLQSQYQLVENRLTVFGSVLNILNEKYSEIIGFSTKGTNVKLGLKFNF